MNIKDTDIKIETMRGTGPGGQHRNKTNSAVRATHIPTGISAYADERSQKHSKRLAIKDLKKKIKEVCENKKAIKKKENRDDKIHNTPIIRTYNFPRNEVKDHRTKKKASIKEILDKGNLDLLK